MISITFWRRLELFWRKVFTVVISPIFIVILLLFWISVGFVYLFHFINSILGALIIQIVLASRSVFLLKFITPQTRQEEQLLEDIEVKENE